MKAEYKELQKKLANHYEMPKDVVSKGYGLHNGVVLWLVQCGIEPNLLHTKIIYNIFGSVPYPYQEQDRKIILKYLKKKKFKVFKNESGLFH